MERFITCNTDILTDLNIRKLIRFHETQKALISFGVTDRKSSRVGLFDEENRLCGWRNVQTGEERVSIANPNLVAKAYSFIVVIFEYEIFELMKKAGFSGKFSLIDVYLKLAAHHRIMGYDHSGDRLVDVGKPESLEIAETLFK